MEPATGLVGRSIRQYRILELIGSGGMGEVYKAQDTELGRLVAVKVLPVDLANNPDRVRRFKREARAIASRAVSVCPVMDASIVLSINDS